MDGPLYFVQKRKQKNDKEQVTEPVAQTVKTSNYYLGLVRSTEERAKCTAAAGSDPESVNIDFTTDFWCFMNIQKADGQTDLPGRTFPSGGYQIWWTIHRSLHYLTRWQLSWWIVLRLRSDDYRKETCRFCLASLAAWPCQLCRLGGTEISFTNKRDIARSSFSVQAQTGQEVHSDCGGEMISVHPH